MKLFYKKDYFRILDELRKTRCILEEEKEKKQMYIDRFYDEERANQVCLKTIEEMHFKIEDYKKQIKSLKNAKGGYASKSSKLKKEKEELEKQIAELNEKLAESMTDKYLVRKIKSGKTANTLKTKVRSSSVQSNIVKNLYKE